MITHEPPSYQCPFCKLVNHENDEINRIENIIYEDENTLAFVSPKWWKNNPGNVIIIPKIHTENIFSISPRLLSQCNLLSQKIAFAMKATYNCDGISTRQHNEPAGNQDVWHFHLHVFPRWQDDKLYENHMQTTWVDQKIRMQYVKKLREYFVTQLRLNN